MFFLMQLYRLEQIMVEFVPKSAESAFFGHFQPKINQNRPNYWGNSLFFTKIVISQDYEKA